MYKLRGISRRFLYQRDPVRWRSLYHSLLRSSEALMAPFCQGHSLFHPVLSLRLVQQPLSV